MEPERKIAIKRMLMLRLHVSSSQKAIKPIKSCVKNQKTFIITIKTPAFSRMLTEGISTHPNTKAKDKEKAPINN